MKDVQSGPADVALAINRVGVKGLRTPLVVRDKANGEQHTVASVDLSVDLPGDFKGTHMSRFIEAMEQWEGGLDYTSCMCLMTDIRQRLEASRAHAVLRFPYFVRKKAPSSGSSAVMHYDCTLESDYSGQNLNFLLTVEIPVMTVCPCSLAISDFGAHSQRAIVRISCRSSGFVWIEDLVEVAETSGSSPVFSLLKREDEKSVTETAFSHPMFVEDVVRAAAQQLDNHERVTWYRVEVESLESIHNHSAFAVIKRDKTAESQT
ncbi:MAG: GTP cyclohydrolase FolE2 [Desulfovibrio sp.]|uniref:GTP cyclohydrolase FolE2 n=1 Tax=Desulfovibrio sp. 7SRBS1 TaxID=3378064 RepID=UPI003B3C4DC7